VDCDRFFDEVAEANEKFLENEIKEKLKQKYSGDVKQIKGVESS
jgi:hypothetical protein